MCTCACEVNGPGRAHGAENRWWSDAGGHAQRGIPRSECGMRGRGGGGRGNDASKRWTGGHKVHVHTLLLLYGDPAWREPSPSSFHSSHRRDRDREEDVSVVEYFYPSSCDYTETVDTRCGVKLD